MLKIKGRHCAQAKFDPDKIRKEIICDAAGGLIRLDDDNNADWWLEIYFTKKDLQEMLDMMQ